MRQETQHWQYIKLQVEIVDSGAGQTGLTVTGTLRRVSDGLYLQGGGTWGASPANLTLTEVSAANAPGLYRYDVPTSSIDIGDDAESHPGWLAMITETTNSVREFVHIVPSMGAGEMFRMLGARQENMRFLPSAWHATSLQPTAGTVWVYPDSTTMLADAVPDGTGSIAEYLVVASYDGTGRLTGYRSANMAI